MSIINKNSDDIKKKLTLNDYSKTARRDTDLEVSQPSNKLPVEDTDKQGDISSPAKEVCCHAGKATCKHESMPAKIKATYYLTPEANKQFTGVYVNRLNNDKKTDRSALICEAIKLLHKNEF